MSTHKTLTHASNTIYAAGAILYRKASRGIIEVAVIHRPHYNDWSLPKGKLDKHETILQAADRELQEETGYEFHIRGYLRKVVYYVQARDGKSDLNRTKHAHNNSRPKHVYYWAAELAGGEFQANEEVDQLQWLSVEKATAVLSYSLDQEVLREFVTFPTHAHPLALVRHAKAGNRTTYVGDDAMRPLDKHGTTQAQALVPWFQAIGATQLLSAPKIRCINTLSPYAATSGYGISVRDELSDDAFAASPRRSVQAVLNIAAESQHEDTITAISSQGDFIPGVLTQWAQESTYPLADLASRKASMWLISHHQGSIVRAHYLPDPLAFPLT